jgi:hypothetical protein
VRKQYRKLALAKAKRIAQRNAAAAVIQSHVRMRIAKGILYELLASKRERMAKRKKLKKKKLKEKVRALIGLILYFLFLNRRSSLFAWVRDR